MTFRSHARRFLRSAARFVLITSAAAFLAVFVQAQSPATSSAASVEGLWGVETRLGIPVQGLLTIDSRGGKWEASIAGYTVPATLNGKRLTFSLPGKLGALHGHFDAQTQGLRGEWIQSARRGLGRTVCNSSQLSLKLAACVAGRRGFRSSREFQSTCRSSGGMAGSRLSPAIPKENFFDRRVYSITQEGKKSLHRGAW